MNARHGLFVVVGLVLLLALVLPHVVGADMTPPCRLKGSVQIVNGTLVPDGTVVTARVVGAVGNWTNGTFTCTADIVHPSYVGESVYVIDIPCDNSETTVNDGGRDGDVVHFTVRWGGVDFPVLQTGAWQNGMFVPVDLVVDTSMPVATLSGEPTGVVSSKSADITVGGPNVVAYKYRWDSDPSWSDETNVSTHIERSSLSEGPHWVSAIGKNAAGTWQPEAAASMTDTWVVDTIVPGVPSLVSPVNGAKITDTTTPAMDWTDVVDATGVTYSLQIDDNVDFSSPVVNKTDLSLSRYTVLLAEQLALGGYDWRVRATDGAGNQSDWTAPWSFVVEETGGLATPVLQSPADGTRTNDTTPTFAWSGDGVTYTLQIDNNSDFSSPVLTVAGISGSPYTLTGAEALSTEGTYYWHVMAANVGQQSGWSLAWSFVLDTTPPTATISGAPTGTVSYNTANITVDGTDVVFYRYQMDGGAWSSETAVGTLIGLSALSDGPHTLFVVGRDIAGNWQADASATTASWTVATPEPVAVLSGVPAALVSITTVDITVSGTGVISYSYKLDSGSWYGETNVSTHIQRSGLSDGLHTIYVIGKNDAGNWQEVAAATTASWTVDTTAPTATLTGAPTGTVTYNTADITVGGSDVVSYKYKLDAGSWSNVTAVATHISLSKLSDGSHTISVIGKDTVGNWQTVANATIATWTVATPEPKATMSGQPTGTVSYKYAFIDVAGQNVVSFKYKLDGGVWSIDTAVGNEAITLNMLGDGLHTVYVIGKNDAGHEQTTANATTVSWTVDTTAPAAPTLVGPADKTVTNLKSVVLDWSDVTDTAGVSYQVQIDNESNFGLPIPRDIENVATSTYTVTGLADGTYYWRVKTWDGAVAPNKGSWSSVWSFTIDTVAPAAPTLVSPENLGKVKTNPPQLVWTEVTDPSGVTYVLQISKTSDFSSLELELSGIVGGSYTLAEKLDHGTYYWRVQAVDGAGNAGPWSDAWAFDVKGMSWWWIVLLVAVLAAGGVALLTIMRRRRSKKTAPPPTA